MAQDGVNFRKLADFEYGNYKGFLVLHIEPFDSQEFASSIRFKGSPSEIRVQSFCLEKDSFLSTVLIPKNPQPKRQVKVAVTQML